MYFGLLLNIFSTLIRLRLTVLYWRILKKASRSILISWILIRRISSVWFLILMKELWGNLIWQVHWLAPSFLISDSIQKISSHNSKIRLSPESCTNLSSPMMINRTKAKYLLAKLSLLTLDMRFIPFIEGLWCLCLTYFSQWQFWGSSIWAYFSRTRQFWAKISSTLQPCSFHTCNSSPSSEIKYLLQAVSPSLRLYCSQWRA